MQLRTGIVAIVVAAAAGAAAMRAYGWRAPQSAAPLTSSTVAGSAFDVAHQNAGVTESGDRRLGADRRPSTAMVVYVAGAVRNAGVYTLPASARVVDALHAAGGPTSTADLVAVDLAARVEDGEEVAVPARGAVATYATAPRSGVSRRTRRHGVRGGRHSKRHRHRKDAPAAGDESASTDAPLEAVDINAADEATLETLPGVGPSLAQRLIAFRDLNGPFASSDELLDVGGMTAGKVDALAPYLTF